MEMKGEVRLAASRQFIWDALNNPEVLKSCIPGCEALDQIKSNEYTATVISKVGPIKARFEGKVTLSDIDPPKSYKLSGEGSGGAAGFAKADIKVSLDSIEHGVTLLRYSVHANVGGKLAQLGSRMIDAAAKKSADDFFEQFGKKIQESQTDIKDLSVDPNAIQAMLEGMTASKTDGSDHDLSDEAKIPRAYYSSSFVINDAKLDSAVCTQAATEVLTSEKIKVWLEDSIAVITLNNPKSKNAMTLSMWRAIPGILSALESNSDVRVVILTGAGEDFCAGADIAEFEKVRADAQQANEYEQAVDACCDAIFNFKKPTIAVLRGYCLGGGAHLAMSCDFRYADSKAIFGIPAARLSIIYGVRGTKKLLSLVGLSQAKKILIGAQRFGADEALNIGFVDHVPKTEKASTPRLWERLIGIKAKETVQDPMLDAREFAIKISENAPLSMAGAKYQLNGMVRGSGGLNMDIAETLIAEAADSHDYREGRAAFSEKRKPNFKGR